jgi:microcystin-dependent protein
MADPFLAEIRILPFNTVPKSWALCDGQLMSITQNTALFALLGTTYGGDGIRIFGLPNLQGSAPMAPGNGPGLSPHVLGEFAGSDTVTLTQNEIPGHSHSLLANAVAGDTNAPSPSVSLARSHNANAYQTTTDQNVVRLSDQALVPAGKGFPHNNMMPFLTLNFRIALAGVFPPRG